MNLGSTVRPLADAQATTDLIESHPHAANPDSTTPLPFKPSLRARVDTATIVGNEEVQVRCRPPLQTGLTSAKEAARAYFAA